MARPHPSTHALLLCALIALAAPPAHAREAGGNAASWTPQLQALTASWWPRQIAATIETVSTYVSKAVYHGLPASGSAGKLPGHREVRGGRRNLVPVFIGCAGNASDPNGPCH